MDRKAAIIETGVRVPYDGPRSYGVPISLSKTMREMKPGQSFRLDDPIHRRNVTATSHHTGIKVRTRKMENGTLLVTRI